MKTTKRIELRVRRERLGEEAEAYCTNIQTPAHAVHVAKSVLKESSQEVFLTLPLDIKNRILGYVETARGSVDSCRVDIREVFRTAIVMGASGLILVHNHPSGDLTPSSEDIELTKRVYEAGRLLSIAVLDHLIVTDDGFVSLAELGLFPFSPQLPEIK